MLLAELPTDQQITLWAVHTLPQQPNTTWASRAHWELWMKGLISRDDAGRPIATAAGLRLLGEQPRPVLVAQGVRPLCPQCREEYASGHALGCPIARS